MKFKEILANINSKLETSIGNNICEEVGLNDMYDTPDQDRLKCYFIQRWQCTDSCVGCRAYFLDGEFICKSFQRGRKWDEEFTWISKEAFYKCHQYLLTLVEPTTFFNVTEDLLEEEWDDTYPIEYSSQILQKQALWYNGEVVDIVKSVFPWGNDDYFHAVVIKTQDGIEHKITVDKLKFNYNT